MTALRPWGFFFVALSLAFSLTSCSDRANDVSALDFKTDGKTAEILLDAFLAVAGPRPSGSRGAKFAAMWIFTQAKNFGYKPQIDTFQEKAPSGDMVTFRNVTFSLRGRGAKTVILGSHYDTKVLLTAPNFIGANDSGSSTAVLLTLAKQLKPLEGRLPYTILFAFFDGEECVNRYDDHDGLVGSRRLAEKLERSGDLKKTLAVVLLDMIGDRDLTITLSPDTTPELAKAAADAARELGHPDSVREFDSLVLDDHSPFQKRGVPAIDLIDFDFGPKNAYWHTPEDTRDKVSRESLAFAGDLTLAILRKLPAALKR